MQQTLVGCAFCDAPPGTETGEAHTCGQYERVTHPICADCATQSEPDPDERGHVAYNGCGLVIHTLAALTRFRVELGHLEGPLQLCARCSPGGLATGDQTIVELNSWGDTYWGIKSSTGEGKNMLGRILMSVRSSFAVLENPDNKWAGSSICEVCVEISRRFPVFIPLVGEFLDDFVSSFPVVAGKSIASGVG